MTELTALASIAEIDAAVAGRTAPLDFLELVRAHPDSPALHSMRDDGGWNSWTFREFADQVASAVAGLASVGVGHGDQMLLLMRNRPDFHWFDAAAQFLRATAVSIYNSSSPEEIQYLAGHAEARVAIVEDEGFLDRILQVRAELPTLERIYVIEPPRGPLPEGVFPASELLNGGNADLDELASATDPADIATLIYTSGTTGPPKGVMISQYNVVYTIDLLRRSLDFEDFLGMRVVSYLPMAHIAERAVSHYQLMMLGYSVYCCPDPAQLTVYLKEVRPQMTFGVPRVWEKIYNGVNAALAGDPERKAQFDDGVQAAIDIRRSNIDGAFTDEQQATLDFLDDVAFSNVRALIGLDAIELAVTGAAPFPSRCSNGSPPSAFGSSRSTGCRRPPAR